LARAFRSSAVSLVAIGFLAFHRFIAALLARSDRSSRVILRAASFPPNFPNATAAGFLLLVTQPF
jgi:hypothetical protein